MNVLEGSLEREGDGLACRIGTAALTMPPEVLTARPALAQHLGRPIAVGIRPEALDEPGRRDGGDGGRLRGRVLAVEALGPEQLVHVEVEAEPVLVEDVLEGLVDEEEADGPVEIRSITERARAIVVARLDASARVRARRADRACGRPPPPPLLRPRERRGDRRLRRPLQSRPRAAHASRRVDVRRLRPARRSRRRRRGVRLLRRGHALSLALGADDRRRPRRAGRVRAGRAARRGVRPGVGDRARRCGASCSSAAASRRRSPSGTGSDDEVEAVLELELASDFADIFAVKRVEDLGAPGTSEVAPSRPERWKDAGTVEFADDGLPRADARAPRAVRPTTRTGGAARYRLAARARRALAARASPCSGS